MARAKKTRVGLPNGTDLEVSVRGAGAEVYSKDGAFVLSAKALLEDGDEGYEKQRRPPDETIELHIRHPIDSPEHLFVPHLTPEPGYVIGDRCFRCPAIVIGGHTIALAFVVDVEDVYEAESFRVWLDYDHPTRTVILGAGMYREEGHVFYVREPHRRLEIED